MLPNSCARAAGLKSEIRKVTITRVACNEIQYHRLLDSYKRELRVRIHTIHREQDKLNRSLIGYLQKIRQDKYTARLHDQNKQINGSTESNDEINYQDITVPSKTQIGKRNESKCHVAENGALIRTARDDTEAERTCPVNKAADKDQCRSHNHVLHQADITKRCKEFMERCSQKAVPRGLVLMSEENSKDVESKYTPQSVDTDKKEGNEEDEELVGDRIGDYIRHRIPDTRDNAYFRGVHGELSSSCELRRLSAAIYPIKHGYGGHSDNAGTLPSIPGNTSKSRPVGAFGHWNTVRQKQVVNRRSVRAWVNSSKSKYNLIHPLETYVRGGKRDSERKSHRPSVGPQRPTAIPYQLSDGSQRSTAVPHQHSSGSHRPVAVPCQLSIGSHRPVAVPRQHSIGSHRPVAVPHQLSYRSHRPTAIPHKLSNGSHRPTIVSCEHPPTSTTVAVDRVPTNHGSVNSKHVWNSVLRKLKVIHALQGDAE